MSVSEIANVEEIISRIPTVGSEVVVLGRNAVGALLSKTEARLRKYGSIVSVEFFIHAGDLNLQPNDVIGNIFTIPQGYRPLYAQRIYAIPQQYAELMFGTFVINTGGTVNYYFYNYPDVPTATSTWSNMWGYCEYLTLE